MHKPLDMPIGLELVDDPTSPTGPNRLRQAIWAFIGLGVLLRVATYALKFPLWADEAFVAAHFIARGYWALLRPLDYGQICPLFFLWLELTATKLFGFCEWSLRLIPTLCSVASVFLFAHVSARVTRGAARLLAVAGFCVAFFPIRHGAEVKPYATDLFAALVLFALAIEWWRAPENNRWLWALAAVVPLALGLSHPAVFMAGGISLGLAGMVWRARRQGAIVPFTLYNLLMVVTFGVLFAVFTSAQQRVFLATLRANYWVGAFPPLAKPVKFLLWLAEAHTGRMFAYPLGGAQGSSTFTTLCFLVALVVL
ncbi:MAG TPA: hypothetical protein VGY53_04005, partial [Isosphaeraceae bacterium]|nr:hypothetical protein [Isosphaeraceae bacterium]